MSEYLTRFMREVGTRAFLRVYWGNSDWKAGTGDCPNGYGHGTPGIHNAQIFLVETTAGCDENLGGNSDDYPPDRWPTKCDHCDAVVPADSPVVLCSCGCGQLRRPATDPSRHVYRRTLYEAQDGTRAIRADLEPDDMYWATWFGCADAGGRCYNGWTNCDGRHLIVSCPGTHGSHPWDVDSRASNCTLPEDTTHRCWVRHGDPEREPVTVDKTGVTCGAGGGSIQIPGWHGVLSAGILRQC